MKHYIKDKYLNTKLIRLTSILLAFFTLACSNYERLDTGKIKDQMDTYQIKRVSPTQIAYQVEDLGRSIGIALTENLENQLKKASTTEIANICALKNNAFVDSLSQKYNAKITLLGQPDIANNKNLLTKEREVLEAYADNVSKKLSIDDNSQKIGDTLFVYTSPIPYQKGVSKLCFGNETGFAVWSIHLKKAEIIKSINLKKLKQRNIK